MPQFPQFKKLELSDKEEIEKFTGQFEPYSDFNFVSLYSWNTKDEFKICFLNGNFVVRFLDYDSLVPFYTFLGNTRVLDTLDTLTELAKSEGITTTLKMIPEVNLEKEL